HRGRSLRLRAHRRHQRVLGPVRDGGDAAVRTQSRGMAARHAAVRAAGGGAARRGRCGARGGRVRAGRARRRRPRPEIREGGGRGGVVARLAGAGAAAERGAVPGGTERNAASVADAVSFAAGVDRTARLLLADAQTSGGLLIAVAAERADALVAALRREATPAADVIGRVVTGAPGTIA